MTWYYCHYCRLIILNNRGDEFWTCKHAHTDKEGKPTGGCIMCIDCGRYIGFPYQVFGESQNEVQTQLKERGIMRINNN